MDMKRFVKALKIEERIPVYEKNHIYNMGYDEFQKWANIRGLISTSDIAELYSLKDITSEEINNVLKDIDDNEISAIAKDIKTAEWFTNYNMALNRYAQFSSKIQYNGESVDLAIAVAPFVLFINEAMLEVKKNVKNIEISEDVIKEIGVSSANLLLGLIIKTLVWDFRSNNGVLNSNSKSDAQLKKYLVDTFSSNERIAEFYERYPVCARRVTERMADLKQHFSEALIRLDENYFTICEKLEMDANACKKLMLIDAKQGDTHQQGRAVIKMTLGKSVILYKPRNLEVEKLFFEVANNFCINEGLLDLYENKCFLQNEYTFECFVEYESCDNERQIERFYTRFGQLCAFVYLFGGNDVHYENIIAHNEYPVIIDMETLFQHSGEFISFGENAHTKIYNRVTDSIETTALLPLVSFRQGKKGVDISALNGRGAELPYNLLQLVDASNDNIRFEKTSAFVEDQNNVPMLKNKKVDFLFYRKFIIAGMEKTFLTIMEKKDYFIGEHGILGKFKGMNVRQLMRPTNAYAKMMDFSSHPNYSCDMAMLERMFCNVWAYPFKDKRVIIKEMEDMLRGDIPIFFKKVSGKALISSNGESLEDYFEGSGYDKVYNKLVELDNVEINRQMSHAKISMGLYNELNIYQEDSIYSEQDLFKNMEKDALFSYVSDLANEIRRVSVIDTNSRTVDWAGIMYDNDYDKWKIASIGHSYCYGVSAIMVFMFRLAKYDRQYFKIAEFIAEELMNIPYEKINDLGLKTGITGILFALLEAYTVEKKGLFKEISIKIVDSLEERIDNINDFSFENGLLGIINTLCEVINIFGSIYD